MSDPIKIFIGTEPAQWLPTEVLKRSILTRTKTEVEFCDLIGIDLGLRLKMYTGFSFYRYAIPEKSDYKGRSLYLDADMVVLGDIADLHNLDMNGHNALARIRNKETYFTSVMLMDCAKLKHWKVKEWVALINAGLTSYSGCMSGGPSGMNHDDFGPLPEEWNHFDHYDDTTKLIHYTNVPTQPWKRPGHPYRGAFLSELKAALDDGTVTEKAVEKEIQAKHIYPNILHDMEEYVSK
ncbi:MAG: glycosyltransferase [Chlamydiota bacterium]|nr:glycosyltransferase [Chlamydiota bacterium]